MNRLNKINTVTLYDGNGKRYKQAIPKLYFINCFGNDVAINHFEKQTGLKLVPGWDNTSYEAQPTTEKQFLKVFMTYNFKTQYVDNWNHKNTIFLRSMHNVGFEVTSICYDCAKHNNITLNGLGKKDRLSC